MVVTVQLSVAMVLWSVLVSIIVKVSMEVTVPAGLNVRSPNKSVASLTETAGLVGLELLLLGAWVLEDSCCGCISKR